MGMQRLPVDCREETSFAARPLRDVLGSFPTGVAVVTATAPGGELYGVTVNSFNSVSLDPPLVLFSLCRNLLSLDGIVKAGAFAINFLRDDQAHLSVSFANARSDKWRGVEFRPGVTGSPILVPALAVLECQLYAQYDGGDHVIVVGQVVHVEMDSARHPLVFFRGRYHRLLHGEHGQ